MTICSNTRLETSDKLFLKMFSKKTILRDTGSHCDNRNENDVSWDILKENAEVPHAMLFTPRPSQTALFEGFMV